MRAACIRKQEKHSCLLACVSVRQTLEIPSFYYSCRLGIMSSQSVQTFGRKVSACSHLLSLLPVLVPLLLL